MQTYVLIAKWESTRRALDLDHLRKWLANLYGGTLRGGIDVYTVNKDGSRRFLGKFGGYNYLPVWYTKLPAAVNDCRVIDKKTGKLM